MIDAGACQPAKHAGGLVGVGGPHVQLALLHVARDLQKWNWMQKKQQQDTNEPRGRRVTQDMIDGELHTFHV